MNAAVQGYTCNVAGLRRCAGIFTLKTWLLHTLPKPTHTFTSLRFAKVPRNYSVQHRCANLAVLQKCQEMLGLGFQF